MKLTRITVDEHGESHFQDDDIPLTDAGAIGMLSEPMPAEAVIFRENAPDYDYDWHHAPRRQLIVLLDGAIEIEVSGGGTRPGASGGERRTFRGGDVLLVEDTWGKGHRTRTIDGKPRRSLFIALEAADHG